MNIETNMGRRKMKVSAMDRRTLSSTLGVIRRQTKSRIVIIPSVDVKVQMKPSIICYIHFVHKKCCQDLLTIILWLLQNKFVYANEYFTSNKIKVDETLEMKFNVNKGYYRLSPDHT